MRPTLTNLDWSIIILYGGFAVALGIYFTKRAGRGVDSFFVGDRKLTWWVAGTSIVATTFAADTPLAVTGIVATGGISGNWLWWCWAIAHLTATFLFARLWRRSGVITDAEITELRYAGRPAAVLRGFKAIYFGVFINCITMAWVIAAMVKISRAFFDVDPWIVIVVAVSVALLYTVLGGFHSVVVTDLVQFGLGMAGAIALAIIAADHFGGLGSLPAGPQSPGEGLLGQLAAASARAGEDVADTLAFVPYPGHPTTPLIYFIVLLVAGWWRYAEGVGYTVQRLAACKDEGHAQAASLWYAVAHNALRPWPWLLVGLAALIVYPSVPGEAPSRLTSPRGDVTVMPATLDATGGEVAITGVHQGTVAEVMDQRTWVIRRDDGQLTARFGGFLQSGIAELRLRGVESDQSVEGLRVELKDREIAYPLLMGRFLPAGLLGLVIASLLAAFMSTIDTHSNWGASYLVRDLYQRFIRPNASPKQCVLVSRLCIVGIGILAGLVALSVKNIAEVWGFIVALGAGLGSVTAARWYWHRVTAHAEFAALGVTTILAVGLQLFASKTLFGGENPLFLYEVKPWLRILIIATASLATWIPVALFGPQNDPSTLRRFAARVRPPGPGWRHYVSGPSDPLRPALLRLLAGGIIVYGTLFGIGFLILGPAWQGALLLALAAFLLGWIIRRAPAPAKAGAESPASGGASRS